jgi:Tfp pilus assembly protein PilF
MTPFFKVCIAIGFFVGICLSTQSQVRFAPQESAIVLNASVHDKGAQNSAFSYLTKSWRSQPQDLSVSLAYARAVFQIGLAEGDLRWFGAAKAALLPWWKNDDIPADAFFMRGLVKQGFHDFTGGLSDINKAIDLNPNKAEFWSWRFAMHLLRTDLVAAQQDCESMDRLFGQDESKAYRAILRYRTGDPQTAIGLLKTLVTSPNFQSASSKEWLALHLGEAYRVAGQSDMAIATWKKQLKITPKSHIIKLSLAELWIQEGQYLLVKEMSGSVASTDALLMQYILAYQGLKDPEEKKLAALLESRLKSQSLRQEALIERPQLIYFIDYANDPAAGLRLSIENWQIQQEPRDAVLFLKAALALNQPQAAQSVLAWLEKTQYLDPQIKELGTRLKIQIQSTQYAK